MSRTLLALIRKELLTELRTKDTVGAGLVFAILVLAIFNFAFDLRTDTAEAVAPGALWVAFIFAGLLGIGRSFAVERDRGTFDALLLAPIDRGVIYLAKATSSCALMLIVEVVATPIFVALFDVEIDYPAMAAVIFLGTVGFVGVGTLVAAITATARARDVLLPTLLLPLEVPVVIASVRATAAAMGAQSAGPLPWLQLLVGFDVILVAASYIVFEYAIDD